MNPTSANKKKYLSKARTVIRAEADAVHHQLKHLNRDFWNACTMISSCPGRVVVMGIGKSGLIGRKMVATLSSTGTPSFFMHPVETMHGDLGMLMRGDIVMALSYSGETAELNTVLPHLKKIGISLIAITARPHSRLGKAADVIIRCSVPREACPYNIVPTSSSMGMQALGDTLALVVMDMKGFNREDFAHLHPGGTLGRKLTLTVQDLMHTGALNPTVREHTKVRDAILIMTRCRLGATNVVDSRGMLTGFFTDGDLRRHVQTDPHILKRPIGSVMTKNPCSVQPSMLAVDAAALIKSHRFDNIPVVDKKGRSVGIIDERDLMAAGIV
ncbi:MAG: KpsF/GutQ family sugar-phosphate isomerase [Elusimicrobia bacterium]|nr:KpsF/GutQ family sugar-phosphate isomerase [Elusimicrobiota bacterium]MBD3411617.1 KpsF/GutQ family sugar-phosphate isomerase [Elusimicrobiota bacterium]